jgi:hypothetical protein
MVSAMAETNWANYAACTLCGAAAGDACTTVGALHGARRRMPHRGRPTVVVTAKRGGKRATPARAKLTAQIVAMVEPAVRQRIDDLAEHDEISQGEIIRAIIAVGLPEVEAESRRRDLEAEAALSGGAS